MSSLRRLVPYALKYRRAFLLGLGCVAVSSTVVLLSPRVLKAAVDDLAGGVTGAKLTLYAGLLLLIAAVGGCFRFLMRRILIGASRHIESDLRNEFFAKLQQLPLAYYHTHRTGDLMSRATNDLSAVRMMIGPAVMYFANTAITASVAVAVMLGIDPWLTAMALLPLPVLSMLVKFFGGAIHREFERVQAQLSELSAVAQESLSGVRVVRAYGQEQAEIDRFADANREYVRRNRRLIRWQGTFFPSMTLLLGLAALLVLWLGSRQVILGRISVGELVAFNAYLAMLSWPMIAFGWVTNLLQRGTASWKRMLEVLDAVPAIRDQDTPSPGAVPDIDGLRGMIEFRHLTFAYDGCEVLHDVSARVAPGQTLAIVGPTGAGKSTLVHLLARLHDPPRGTIFIDGVDVRDIPLSVLRGAIGLVPQEPFLFSVTVGENVAFGTMTGDQSSVPGELVTRAAGIAKLDRDVQAFANRYETMVGERGITLSGGQRQRAAIARAVFVEPRILVLDDALSAVDTYTEDEILSQLRTFMRGRTSIVIAHRISTVREADQILVLDQGRLVERGTHDDLVGHNGLYAELHRKQLLEDELAVS